MEVYTDEKGLRRVKDVEYVLPVVMGTCAWWLGKKASDVTHRWTVYLRGAAHEDLSHVINHVTFELHQTFAVPKRPVYQQPWEVSESGWGEFDINITIHFQPDVCEPEVTLMHKLRLYESEQVPSNTKKPVVSESYDELVFVNPVESFYARLQTVVPRPLVPELSCKAWCLAVPDDSEELARLRECRARIAVVSADLRREFDALK